MRKPPRNSLPAPDVRDFRAALNEALAQKDEAGRTWADARWGVYAFYDYDHEPIYVGQTNEQLRTRVRRHLTNQRTDAVAMRILDVFEVADIELWPLWEFEDVESKHPGRSEAQSRLNSLEYSVYLEAIAESQFGAILNEKIPPVSPLMDLPPSLPASLISESVREERGHPDVRIARRADTLARLSAVARERGEVTEGLRRVMLVQALRLAYLSAVRLAQAEGREPPDPSVIQSSLLVGNVRVDQDESED